jgi:hypothetical protein
MHGYIGKKHIFTLNVVDVLCLQMNYQWQKLLLIFAVVCCYNVVCTAAFDIKIPNYSDIKDLFSDLLDKVKSGEEKISQDEPPSETGHERLKRQVSNIGDESPNAYEIRSSR